jgi:tetratricopeptide (TPR) repeat protein
MRAVRCPSPPRALARRAAVQQTALRAAQRLGEPAEHIRACRYLAGAFADLGRFRDAHEHIQRALDLAVAAGDRAAQARIHYERNLLYGLQGRSNDALDAAREALGLFEAVGDRAGRATALTDVGWHHSRLRDHERALPLLRQALAAHQRLGNHAYQAHTWACLGGAYEHLGDQPEAVACYGYALDLFRSLGDKYGEASTHAYLAGAHEAAGDLDAAREARRDARHILDTLDPDATEQLHNQLHYHTRPRGDTGGCSDGLNR